MVTSEAAEQIIAEIEDALAALDGRDAVIHATLAVIARDLPYYKWVGVYIADGGVLNLGPYIGAKTEHTLIAIGDGVCGTALAEERDIVVEDVRTLDNYLSCSVETRSEIVVLIREPSTGQILGQIDADGHEVGDFDSTDEALLRRIADRLAPRLWTIDG